PPPGRPPDRRPPPPRGAVAPDRDRRSRGHHGGDELPDDAGPEDLRVQLRPHPLLALPRRRAALTAVGGAAVGPSKLDAMSTPRPALREKRRVPSRPLPAEYLIGEAFRRLIRERALQTLVRGALPTPLLKRLLKDALPRSAAAEMPDEIWAGLAAGIGAETPEVGNTLAAALPSPPRRAPASRHPPGPAPPGPTGRGPRAGDRGRVGAHERGEAARGAVDGRS